ncbi:MAG: Sapep family Mn(2+)-dependent dipeptidase [Clostridia bacterium]|nr:Sapep family Mn(2+)-dependent dipeptidase [Clostridia bacterium]
MLEMLAEIMEIPSEKGEPAPGAPFGEECRKALDWFLQKSEQMGFRTHDLDGYCGYAEYGEGEEMLGILCHLDVVPAGGGWTYPPYKLTVDQGKLYGRGVVDDKGSVVMCLKALEELKNNGVKFNKRVRIIAGCDEEHGSACIKHYVQHDEMPTMSFVPDADFPLINSEKGILHLNVTCPLDKFFEKNIAAIGAGDSYNVVPDKAFVSVFKDSPLGEKLLALGDKPFFRSELVGNILAAGHQPDDYNLLVKDKVVVIEAKGVAGHAMAPHNADNAIWKLFTVLGALETDSELVNMMNEVFCNSKAVSVLGIDNEDSTGNQTVSMGIIDIDEKTLYFTLDFRCPVCNKKEDIEKAVKTALPKNSHIVVNKYAPNLFIPPESKLVSSLLEVYEQVTGNPGECLICGGGTYARELKNALAFGPTFRGTETNIHNIDECVPIEEFYKAAEIYKEAIKKLACE